VILLVERLEKSDLRGFKGFLIDYRLNATFKIKNFVLHDGPRDEIASFQRILTVLGNRHIDRVVIWLHETHFNVAHLCQLGDRLSDDLRRLNIALVVVLVH